MNRLTNHRIIAREFLPSYVQYFITTWLAVVFLYWGVALVTGYSSERFCLLVTTCLCVVATIGIAVTYKKGSLRSPITWGVVTSLLIIEIIFAIATFTLL